MYEFFCRDCFLTCPAVSQVLVFAASALQLAAAFGPALPALRRVTPSAQTPMMSQKQTDAVKPHPQRPCRMLHVLSAPPIELVSPQSTPCLGISFRCTLIFTTPHAPCTYHTLPFTRTQAYSMYIWTDMYIYMYTYIYIYIYMYICIRIYIIFIIFRCVYLYIYLHIYTSTLYKNYYAYIHK